MTARTLGAGLALVCMAPAQTPVERARVETAQKLIQNRQWDEARSLLQKLEADCQAAQNATCRPLIDYSIGFLDQQEAATAEAPRRVSLLSEARQRYQNVLARQPDNGATLNSLALVEQALLTPSRNATERTSLTQDIISRWTRAIEADDRNAGQYRVALGNFFAAQNRTSEALAQFRLAAEQAPGEESARRRILELSGALAPTEYANLCASWDGQFPALAAHCYEKLITRLHSQGQDDAESLSENALLRWTSLVSRQDAMTAERLAAIPPGWMPKQMSELRIYVEKPWNNPKAWNWWWTRPDRMAVTAEVATAMGRLALTDPKLGPPLAEACWEGLLNARPNLALEVGEYEGSQRARAGGGLESVLRLYQELASLYFRNPALDPEGVKLNKMVQALFEGKGVFIFERNWKATQPIHTVLAQIFVQRGIWDNGIAGAAFQLRATLDDADRRWKDPQEQFFQPLPEIKALLAQAYLRMGSSRSLDAIRMYIEAAKAYLDTEALDAAGEMLHMAPKAGTLAEPQSATVGLLGRILDARRAPLSVAAVDAKTAPWLFAPSDAVTADFLTRQRFKILADTAADVQPGEQLDAALRTFNLVTTDHPVLVGTADMVRWQQAESRLLASVNAPTAKRFPAFAIGPTQATVIRLTLQGENHPVQIPVAKDTLVAARVVSVLGTSRMLTARPFLTLRQGTIIVKMSSDQTIGLDRMVVKMQQDAKIPLVVSQ